MAVNSVNLYGTGPDAQIDQSQILRAQQLAQLLQQQANAPIESPAPNAPMSWTQGAAKLAEGLAARKQNQKVSALQKDAVAKQQALIQSLFPQQPMAATPLGDSLAPGAGVMQNSATPGAQRPGLPSLTGSREADMALASQPGGLPAYLQSVAAQRAKQQDEANKLTVVPESSGVYQGGKQITQGTPKEETYGEPQKVMRDGKEILVRYGNRGGTKEVTEGAVPNAAQANMAAAELDPETLRTAAKVVASDPTRMRDYATFGAGGQSIRSKINGEITKLKKETGMSDEDFIQARARAKAAAPNIAKLYQQDSQYQIAEDLAKSNGQRVLDLLDLVDQTGIPMIEGFTRSARRATGGVDAAELASVLTTFQTEVARIIASSPTMAGTISDTARKEVETMSPGSMTTEQGKRIINRLFTEMDIKSDAVKQQISKAVGSTSIIPGAPPAATSSAGGHPADIQAILDSLKK